MLFFLALFVLCTHRRNAQWHTCNILSIYREVEQTLYFVFSICPPPPLPNTFSWNLALQTSRQVPACVGRGSTGRRAIFLGAWLPPVYNGTADAVHHGCERAVGEHPVDHRRVSGRFGDCKAMDVTLQTVIIIWHAQSFLGRYVKSCEFPSLPAFETRRDDGLISHCSTY
ncbi:hypothetical protein M404DRAFT_335453 [Pisolithus tinctorius Marx 270]|uniref:Secreted protein n=1 Tax=Pisolithus tinctorius Marx 270 TaxID=870435 RepID=A0A0C3NHJ4_PISTI|nr:hypothetical protein M404DRAFT_335453 [Pisolithus tinctorius Marx 270]